MQVGFVANKRCSVVVALVIGSMAISGCSVAEAQVPSGGFELWRCASRSEFYREREAGISPATTEFNGEFVFHSASPGPQWKADVTARFTSMASDPGARHGNGIAASIGDAGTGPIHVFVITDGRRRLLGQYPLGSAVPFKITFDDSKGTMSVRSGDFEITEKPADLLRPTLMMSCSGADVGIFDTEISM